MGNTSDDGSFAGKPAALVYAEMLTCVRGGEVVLRDLTLAVPAGRATAVIGASGAGKTTLVRCLLGLEEPSWGRVLLDDQPLLDLPTEVQQALMGEVGVLLGGPTLFDAGSFASSTVRESLAIPIRTHGLGDEEHRVGTALAALDLEDVADRCPEELPAYTRRRAAIARALIGDPRLIVLDDIDTGLDPAHRRLVVDAVRAARRRTGATLVFTTHDLGLVRELGDSVAVLGQGRILVDDDPAVVLCGDTDTENVARGYPDAFDDTSVADALSGLLDPRGREPASRRLHADLLKGLGLALLILLPLLIWLLTSLPG